MKFMPLTLLAVLAITSYHSKGADAFGIAKFGNKNVIPSSSCAFQQQQPKVWTSTSSCLNAEAIEVTMPALSSTMKEGRVVSWLKSEGESVEAGEAIMVVESDKADMDVEAFEDGFVAKILVQEGESAPVGQIVALLAAEEDEIEAVAQGSVGAATAATVEEEAPAGESQQQQQQSSMVEGAVEIFMPALSSTMSEGKIVSWLKEVGDEISAGDVLMVVESDKADMDVEAFDDGYLAQIYVPEGQMADVGAPVATLVPTLNDISTLQQQQQQQQQLTPSSTSPTTTAAEPAAATAAPDVPFSQIDMPALSSTMKEGKVVSWLKSEGDAIEAGDAIMVVESDKADMDVEAFEDGFLAAIITGEGEVGAVGAPVALIAENEADISALQAYAATLTGAPAPAAAAPAAPKAAAAPPKPAAKSPAAVSTGARVVASPLAKKRADELGLDLSTVAGTGPNGRITAGDVEKAAAGAPASASKKAAPPAPKKPSWVPADGVIAATPMARAAAKKAKLDLSTIEGTGEFGRVTVFDVKVATGEAKPKRAGASKSASAPAKEMPSGFVPFTTMQRAVSNNMEATLSTPIFRVSREIEMDAFNALYQSVKPKGVTVSALLAKAVAMAIEKYPIINSSYQNGGIQYNEDINIAMAVAIDGGLITPTLKYANERNIMELGENWKVNKTTHRVNNFIFTIEICLQQCVFLIVFPFFFQ